MDRARLKWFHAPMPGWLNLRAIGLAVAAAFCILCLDGFRPEEAPRDAAPDTLLQLDVRLRAADGAAPLAGEIAVFREQKGLHVRVFRGAVKADGHSLKLPEGRYWLLGRADGYARGAQTVRLPSEKSIELSLERAQSRTIEVVHDQGGALVPLAGATVLLRSPEHALPFGALTGSDGRATLADAPSGELAALVYAPGYEPYEAAITGDLLVRLRAVKLLRVRVLADGAPRAGATVSVAGLSLWPARSVQTGPKGTVDLTGLRAGRYTLSAHVDNLVSADVGLELLSEEGIQTVDLELEPGVFIDGLVLDPEGNPIGDARVTHGQAGVSARQLHAVSDAAGLFSVGPLRERGGQLQVGKPGFVTVLEAVTADGPDEIVLVPAGRVEGRVVGADGRPVAGATVEVVGTDTFGMPISVSTRSSAIAGAHFDWALQSQGVLVPAGELGVLLGPVPAIPLAEALPLGGEMLTTDDKGFFGVSEVPPGKVLVLARHPDHMDGRSEAVTLGPGGTARVEVTLGTGRPLRGRVLDHRGFPASDARITVSGKRYDRQLGVAPDGTFFLAAAPEAVRLRIGRAARPLSAIVDRLVEAKERDQEVTVELPAPREASRIVCQDERGEPIALAQVSALSTEATTPLKLTRFTSQTGELELDDTRGLSVRLEVSAPGFVTRSRDVILAAEQKVVLKRAVRASGRVTAVRGRQPAAGAEVSYVAGDVERKALTNDLGEYRLTDVPPGAGMLTVRHAEHGQVERAIVLTPPADDREARLPDVDLQPAIEVSGRVVDEAGAPVPGAILAFDRIGPYVPLLPDRTEVGRAGADGTFQVQVPAASPLYLFAMRPGEIFGFSAEAKIDSRDRAQDVEVLLDRVDEVQPDVRGTVLLALERNPGGSGLVIYSVARGSSAARAGLRAQDRLLAIDGQAVSDVASARDALSGQPGSDVLLDVIAAGTKKSVRVLREPFRR